MHIIVTGGLGFIGSHLVDRLIAQDHQVTSIDTRHPGEIGDQHDPLNNKAYYVRADLSDPPGALHALFAQADFVFHLAGMVGVRACFHSPHESFKHNVLAAYNVVKLCRQYHVPMIESSSSAVYGRIAASEVYEDDGLVFGHLGDRSWTYGLHKAVAEADARAHGFIVARLFNVVGRRQTTAKGFVMPEFVRAIMNGDVVPVYGDGSQQRSFCDVRDAVDGLLLLQRRGVAGEAYNIGAVRPIKILDLALLIAETLEKPLDYRLVPYAEAIGPGYRETMHRCPNIDKIKSLGYLPQCSLEDTVLWIAE